jgi:hypothetical protein
VLNHIASRQKQATRPRETQAKPIIAHRPGMWQVDIKDMQANAYRGYKYILVLVDLHSKFLLARALRNRESQTIIDALEEMSDDIVDKGFRIRVLQGDSEFSVNSNIKDWAQAKGSKVIQTLPHKPTSQGAVERVIGTVSRKIFNYLADNNARDWVSVLPDIVSNINETKHRSTGKQPDEALTNNMNTNDEVKASIEKSASRSINREKRKFPTLQVGDQVRISRTRDEPAERAKLKAGHRKGYSLDGNWSEEIYQVSKVLAKHRLALWPKYKVSFDGVDEEGSYKREDLLKIPGVFVDQPQPRRAGRGGGDAGGDDGGGGDDRDGDDGDRDRDRDVNQPRRGRRVRQIRDPGPMVFH